MFINALTWLRERPQVNLGRLIEIQWSGRGRWIVRYGIMFVNTLTWHGVSGILNLGRPLGVTLGFPRGFKGIIHGWLFHNTGTILRLIDAIGS